MSETLLPDALLNVEGMSDILQQGNDIAQLTQLEAQQSQLAANKAILLGKVAEIEASERLIGEQINSFHSRLENVTSIWSIREDVEGVLRRLSPEDLLNALRFTADKNAPSELVEFIKDECGYRIKYVFSKLGLKSSVEIESLSTACMIFVLNACFSSPLDMRPINEAHRSDGIRVGFPNQLAIMVNEDDLEHPDNSDDNPQLRFNIQDLRLTLLTPVSTQIEYDPTLNGLVQKLNAYTR